MFDSPRDIANLINEDPDILNEMSKHIWDYDLELTYRELEDSKLVDDNGNYYMANVEFTIGADFVKPESPIMYNRDGVGHPGSSASSDWEITSIDDVDLFNMETGQKVRNFKMTPKWE